MSWAFFRAGLSRGREGKITEAAALYRSALDIDAGNVGALNNLGLIEMDDRKYVESQKLIDAAQACLPDRPPRRWYRLIRSKKRMPREGAWYAANFNASALAINRSDALWSIEVDRDTSVESRVDASGRVDPRYEREAHRLSRRVALQALRRLCSKRPFRARADLRQRLEKKTIPNALLIYAAASPDGGTDSATAPKNKRALRRLLKSEQLTGSQALAYLETKVTPTSDIHTRFANAHAHRGEVNTAIKRLLSALDSNHTRAHRTGAAKSMLKDPAFDRLLKTEEARSLRETLEKVAGETLEAIERKRAPVRSAKG